MTPVHLSQARLSCAFGDDLAAAARAYRQGEQATAQVFALHETGLPRSCLRVPGPDRPLRARLREQVEASGDDWRDSLLVVASTTLDIAELEVAAAAGATLDTHFATPLDRLAAELRAAYGFAAAFTLNTACTSAANALLHAARLIARGRYPRALVLAFETPSQIARQGFGVLELASPSGRYRPFHPARDGLVLGEAYASVLLQASRDTQAIGRLLGGASACDTTSLTSTREDGSHIERIVRRALADADTRAEQVALLKLHGTATQANDEAEANGMRRVFGDALPPAFLLKPALGHTLGACGLCETLLMLEALRQGALPPCDYAAEALLPLAAQPFAAPPGARWLANYFGFGGNNASLVLEGLPA